MVEGGAEEGPNYTLERTTHPPGSPHSSLSIESAETPGGTLWCGCVDCAVYE